MLGYPSHSFTSTATHCSHSAPQPHPQKKASVIPHFRRGCGHAHHLLLSIRYRQTFPRGILSAVRSWRGEDRPCRETGACLTQLSRAHHNPVTEMQKAIAVGFNHHLPANADRTAPHRTGTSAPLYPMAHPYDNIAVEFVICECPLLTPMQRSHHLPMP